MNCPRCTVALEWKQGKGTGVNCCPECQGLWLDYSALNKARQASEAELARMKTELRREVGRLVAATTAKVAGKVLTPQDQQRLIQEANREMAA